MSQTIQTTHKLMIINKSIKKYICEAGEYLYHCNFTQIYWEDLFQTNHTASFGKKKKNTTKPHLNSNWVYDFLGDCTWRPQPYGFQSAPFKERDLLQVFLRHFQFIFTCCAIRKKTSCKNYISYLL